MCNLVVWVWEWMDLLTSHVAAAVTASVDRLCGADPGGATGAFRGAEPPNSPSVCHRRKMSRKDRSCLSLPHPSTPLMFNPLFEFRRKHTSNTLPLSVNSFHLSNCVTVSLDKLQHLIEREKRICYNGGQSKYRCHWQLDCSVITFDTSLKGQVEWSLYRLVTAVQEFFFNWLLWATV